MQRRLVRDPVERAMAVRSGRALTALPDGFEPTGVRRVGGVVACAAPDAALSAAAADLAAAGVEVVPLDATALRRTAPVLECAANGWWIDEAVIDAHALVRGFLTGAQARGARIDLRRPTRVVTSGGRVVGVETDDGPVAADAVVVAAGAWAPEIAAALGVHRPLSPRARHLAVLGPDPRATQPHPWVWVDDVGVYLRPEAGGWLCSPCDEVPTAPHPGPGPATHAGLASLADKLGRWAPTVAGAPIRAAWTGWRTFSPDRRPLIGADPEVSGLFWAVGLGGAGVSCAFAVGELVADAVAGRAPDWIDPRALAPGRFVGGTA
jgi:glycine/D-amino acid oxidase-like deaminating enzyme